MNVIFLDFDGVLNTAHYESDSNLEARIAVLADICHEYDCKIVIDALAKVAIDPDSLETDEEWINNIFLLFKKYNIECIGRTPCVQKRISDCNYRDMWKEYEIRLYLMRHPEIEHYCIIDDDDLRYYNHNSDLEKVRDHLLVTEYNLPNNPEKEGLLKEHKEEVGKILEKENNIRRLILKYKNNIYK